MKKRRVDVGFPRVGWYQSSAYLLLTFTLCICALTAFLSGFQLSTANGGACENIRPGQGQKQLSRVVFGSSSSNAAKAVFVVASCWQKFQAWLGSISAADGELQQ